MDLKKTRILVLGSSGMLGSTMFRELSKSPEYLVYGSIRDVSYKRFFAPELQDFLIPNISVNDETGLLAAFSVSKPDVVINCIGIIKQLPNATDHLESLAINSTLPHRLAKYCEAMSARLVHFSTDCVFSGAKGSYKEEDIPDSFDLYGRSKFLGEVNYGNCVTLRTSIIGHELNRSVSLIDWFLSQSSDVKGFAKAIFSGLPTIEIARVVKEFVLPNSKINGLYHLSADPISKYDLLTLVSKTYSKNLNIIKDENFVIDRSLNSDRFRAATGFKSKLWTELISDMFDDYSLYR